MNKDEYFKTLKRICGLAAQIGLDHFTGADTSKEETAYKDALVKLTDDYADLNLELYRLKNEIASAPVHIAAADIAENKRLREAMDAALSEAVKAIYFDDNSDYETYLWSVIRALGGDEAVELLENDVEAAWYKYTDTGKADALKGGK